VIDEHLRDHLDDRDEGPRAVRHPRGGPGGEGVCGRAAGGPRRGSAGNLLFEKDAEAKSSNWRIRLIHCFKYAYCSLC